MEILTFRFHKWCRLHGINHGQPVITKGHLALADYAELRLKAYASRVMTAYLAVALKALMENQTGIDQCSQDLRLVTAATVELANWSLLLETFPYDLSHQQAETLFESGMKLLGFNLRRNLRGKSNKRELGIGRC